MMKFLLCKSITLKSKRHLLFSSGLIPMKSLFPLITGKSFSDLKPHQEKRLNENTINPHVKKMEYAVRGKVVIAADRIAKEIEHSSLQSRGDSRKYKFEKVLYTNIGNPQAVGQAALTWPRQVMALVNLPDAQGIDHPLVKQIFPSDAIDRAREIKAGLEGQGIGAYSHSQGAYCFRKDIADFIKSRDGGIEAHPEDIFMTNGASSAIRMVMNTLAKDEKW